MRGACLLGSYYVHHDGTIARINYLVASAHDALHATKQVHYTAYYIYHSICTIIAKSEQFLKINPARIWQ